LKSISGAKIAFFSHYVGMYGANRSLLDLIIGLKRFDVMPFVILPYKGEMYDVLKKLEIPVIIIPFYKWVAERNFPDGIIGKTNSYMRWAYGVLERLYLNISILPKLTLQLKNWNIDMIYSNSSVIIIGAMAAKKLKLPHIWHLREMVDLHYDLYPDFGKHVFRKTISSSDAIIAVSKAVQSHIFQGSTKKKINIIYNGVASKDDFDSYYNQSENKLKRNSSYTFAIVGNIHKSKGQELSIKALSIVIETYPDTRLLIVGDGEDMGRIKTLVKSLGVEANVDFRGYIKNPYDAYFSSDAILVCSKYEAMGRTTVEGMSACRPVIGLDNSGTTELIEHEKTGLLFEGGAQNLAKCMMQFIAKPDWASKLGYNAWHFARNNFSIEEYSESVYKVICSVLK